MDKKVLYLECDSGISGDMTVAALLDLGADEAVLKKVLDSLPVEGFEILISRVIKSGLNVCDFSVKLDEVHENHDHDMEYLYGDSSPDHVFSHEKTTDDHQNDHHGRETHTHRGLADIMEILNNTVMTENARKTAAHIFQILADAEAKAHGVPVDQVHFHEVGAVDSIVDIVAAAVCFDNLRITDVIVPKLCEGTGHVRCQHGLLPVPVPAVANIAQAHHLNLEITGTKGELVTPTGAAIVAAVCTSNSLPASFSIERIGTGAGKRQYDRPGILRAMLIRPENETYALTEQDSVFCLETNVDDCTGETLGYVMDRLLQAGARDACFIPVFMKKNRPACQVNVICSREKIPEMEEILFAETTTIGIRRVPMIRTVLPRKLLTVETKIGTATVKVCTLPDGKKRFYPEYDSAAELAKACRLTFSEAYDIIKKEAALKLK